jgi:lysophospholipase L1-like esterase
VIFFGANDACLPLAGVHHVPLADYRQNIQKIIEHPTIKAQSPRIILITPPPVNEYQHLEEDRQKGFDTLRRTAENTKLYVDACKDVGKSLQIPVVDIWTAFLKKAGWVEGETLVGSLERPESEIFTGLLSDGKFLRP